jgi:hypothetical protein
MPVHAAKKHPPPAMRCTLESERRCIPVREDRECFREEITTVMPGPEFWVDDKYDENDEEEEEEEGGEKG